MWSKNHHISNKKGISPVIATILMVMITVVLVAFRYTWLQGTMSTATKNTDTAMDAATKARQSVQITTAYQCGDGICFEIKASAANTNAIPMNGTTYYINDAPQNMVAWQGGIGGSSCTTVTTLAPGARCFGNLTLGTQCNLGDMMKVSLSWGSEAVKAISQCV